MKGCQWFFADFLSKIFFILQPEIIYDRLICSFIICLSYPKSHPLSSLSPFFYICSWLGNKPPPEIINKSCQFVVIYVQHFLKVTAI